MHAHSPAPAQSLRRVLQGLLLPVSASCWVACTPPSSLPATATPAPSLPTCVRNAKEPNVSSTSAHDGRLLIVKAFPSKTLGNTRNLRIYLPPSYASATTRKYPVLYMHDGQNLFDASSAAFGVEWQVDETIDNLEKSGWIRETIVVGIDNTGGRMEEYTPSEDDGSGGKGDLYARFVIGEVMPWVDSHFRTQCEAKNTGLAGSSLGGLISLYMGWEYPEHFGNVAAMSTSLWWDSNDLLKQITADKDSRPAIKLWVDVGTGEGDDSDGDGLTYMVEDARELTSVALSKGFSFGSNLGFFEQIGVGHNEAAWASRFEKVPTFFFGLNNSSVVQKLTLIPYGDQVGATGLNILPTQVQAEYLAFPAMTVPASKVQFGNLTPELATFDANGWITGHKAGTAQFSATYGKVSTNASLPVIPYLSDLVDLTIDVTVPQNTPPDATVFISGSIDAVGSWDPEAVPLIQRDAYLWEITLSLPRGTQFEYKFTRGSWNTVEKDEKCAEVQNRIIEAGPTVEEVTVENWADRCQ